jgi:hypothetical protein
MVLFGHRRTVRAFAEISYRFLRCWPYLTAWGSWSLALAGFVAISITQQPERHFE